MTFSAIPSDIFDVIDYDPQSGLFTHKVKSCMRVSAGDRAGSLTGTGYIQLRSRGRAFQAHRVAWFWKTREPVNFEIDHINGIRHDNRIINLRPVTHAQNQWNTGPRSELGKGVTWNATDQKFHSRITANGKRVFLGCYDTEAEARAAYIGAARIAHGKFMRAE